jgi:hypothetical protein
LFSHLLQLDAGVNGGDYRDEIGGDDRTPVLDYLNSALGQSTACATHNTADG